jgi:cystathionine beta-lyase
MPLQDDTEEQGIDTVLVTAGRHPSEHHGFVNPPVYHGSTVLYPDVATLRSGGQRYTYGRRGTPTTDALEEALNRIEGAAGTVLVPSGMSAISTALLSCLQAGDHLLMTDSVYRPTRDFCNRVLARLGIETTYYDPLLGETVRDLFRANTRAIFTESPGSQSFEIQDIPAIVSASRERDLTVLMDNTWATPLYFRALDHGVDITLQAGTKYLVGHSDAMFGTVSANSRAWPKLKQCSGDFGLCAGPDDVYLAQRGLRTMGVRLERHQASGLRIARWLEARPEIARVLHPALESHPQHALWKRDFKGASGLFSVVLHPVPDAAFCAFLDSLKLFGMGYSWGGYESLALPFDPTAYRTATRWTAEGPCIRFHIGLEDPADLESDLSRGFEAMHRAAKAEATAAQ